MSLGTNRKLGESLPIKGLPLPESHNLLNKRPAVSEKTSIACTKIIEPCFPIRRPEDAIFRASPIAHGLDLASPAATGQSVLFALPEGPLYRTLDEANERSLPNIAQVMFSVNEMITRKEITIMFDHRNVTASFPKNTQRVLLP